MKVTRDLVDNLKDLLGKFDFDSYEFVSKK